MLVCFESWRRPLLALLLATAATTYCARGRSQSAAPDAPAADAGEARKASAREHYQEGAKAYSAGHYKDAVDLFLEADRLSPSAPLSFNVARAYELIGDDANALRWYRDYLRRAPTAENAADVKALVSALAARLAQKGVQQLTVLSTPVGATVTIDGTPVGVTPWTGELTPSKHNVLLTYRGYTDERRMVALSASEPRDIDLQMEQSTPNATAPALAPKDDSVGPRFGPAPWIGIGVGAAALGGALGFELARRSAESSAKQETTQLGYQSRLESEQSRQTTARVLAGVGFGLVAVGGVLLLLDSDSPTHTPTATASFMCLPQVCAVSAESRF